MGISLRAGRDFSPADRVGSPPVVIVNEAFVRRYLPAERAVGRTVRVGVPGGERYRIVGEIVGVVGDAVYRTPREGMVETMYVPLAQIEDWTYWTTALLTINAAPGQRANVERAVAAALTAADPTVAFTFGTFDQLVESTMTQERLVAMLSAFFGGLALLLAGIGLYGVVAHAVRARRTEIGVRMALGAEPAGIVRLVFRHVGMLIVAGLALGTGGSLWAARFVARGAVAVPGRSARRRDVRRRGRGAGCRGRAGGVGAGAARRAARPGRRAARRRLSVAQTFRSARRDRQVLPVGRLGCPRDRQSGSASDRNRAKLPLLIRSIASSL
jgi:hypothetical protein